MMVFVETTVWMVLLCVDEKITYKQQTFERACFRDVNSLSVGEIHLLRFQ